MIGDDYREAVSFNKYSTDLHKSPTPARRSVYFLDPTNPTATQAWTAQRLRATPASQTRRLGGSA